MNKPALILVVAFGLSLGLSTGSRIATYPLEPEESLATDSVDANDDLDSLISMERGDSLKISRSTVVSVEDSAAAKSLAIIPVIHPPRVQVADTGMVLRLARIFSAMNAQDAARVLNAMDDNDLQLILLALPRKQQAAILSNLTTDRAAIITRSALRDQQ